MEKEQSAEQIASELHSLSIGLLRAVKRADKASGSTAPRLSALSVIVFSGSVSLGDLAEAEQVRPPTMTRIVHALEQQGLVKKQRNPNDGRSALITATLKGKRLLLQGRARRVQQLSERIHALEAGERQRLSVALGTVRRLVTSLGADQSP